MTVKELKTQLNSLDESTPLAIKTPSGQRDVTKASTQGGYFTFWTDS